MRLSLAAGDWLWRGPHETMGRPAGPSCCMLGHQHGGSSMEDDLEITEDVEPVDEDTLLAQGETDSYDIKKGTNG